jgi:hypothetical protein
MSRDDHNSTPKFQDPPADADEWHADLPTRVRSTALEGIAVAKDVATTAAQQVAAVAGAAAGEARAGMESLRTSIEHADVPALVRRPMTLGAVFGWAAAAALVAYLLTRRRR